MVGVFAQGCGQRVFDGVDLADGSGGATQQGGQPGTGTGGADSADLGGGGSVEPGPVDPSAPRVLATSPADSARGVDVGASINITFDRPMDKALVEQAFSLLVDDTKVDAEFDWNSDATVLTVDPLIDFPAYVTVTSPTELATPIRFTIGTIARDKAGVELPNKFQAAFATLRRYTHTIKRTDTISVSHFDDSWNNPSDSPDLGSRNYRQVTGVVTGRRGATGADIGWIRGYWGYDLSLVPAHATLQSAKMNLTLSEAIVGGFDKLDSATIGQVADYTASLSTTMSDVALAPVWNTSQTATLKTITSAAALSLDVKTAMGPILEGPRASAQIHYRFIPSANTSGLAQINLSGDLVLVYDFE